MISDISEFYTALALHSSAPLTQRMGIESKPSASYYEDYILIEAMFSKMGLEDAFRYVCGNIHESMITESEISFDCSVQDFDLDSFIDMVSSDAFFLNSGKGHILRDYDPKYLVDIKHFETYDNMENRLVKDFLLALQGILDNLRVSSKSDYISRRIDSLSQIVSGMLSERWLKDVGELRTIPFMSTVLVSQYGYSDIFNMYLMLGIGLGFNLDDSRFIFDGHTNKVSQIYEYWCYIQIFKALKNISFRDDWKKERDKRWDVRLRRGSPVTFSMLVNGYEVSVGLLYNHQTASDGRMTSYSVPLRPDFTLVIDGVNLIHLDSKYKLEVINRERDVEDDDIVEVSSWRADIYKMHTYRDAIYHCCGSYVLYPGSDRSNNKRTDDEWYTKEVFVDSQEKDIPSVGAIKLCPGLDNEEKLSKLLMTMIELSTSVSDRKARDAPPLRY